MKFIDLTMSYKNGMRGVRIEPAKIFEEDGWNANTLELYSHSGTHMDAPLHFKSSNKTIDQYPVSRFFCDCWLVDIPGCKPSRLIEPADLGSVADKIKAGEGLLFRTGWSAFSSLKKYRDALPRLSSSLAYWCKEHKISMVGVEPPSVADVKNLSELTEIHNIFLRSDILILEGLCNLDRISAKKIKIVALPLKIKNGDGAPCRVVAIESDET